MNPVWLDSMSWEMSEVYGAITDQILINLAKYFPYYDSGSDLPKSAFTYQAAMLAQMGQVNRETVKIIRNGLKDADSALGNALEQAIIDSVMKAEKPLLQAVKKGIYKPPTTPIVSPNQMRAYKLYYQQASDKLNLVNTVMLESTQSAYRQAVNDVTLQAQINERIQATQTAIDIGAGETVTGVSSWNEAIRHSINRMKQNGITGFVDHAGRHWSAEAYAAMDIRTTVYNTSRAAVWETNESFGNDLYLVSYHNAARELCYEWQNKVISSLNMARDVADLDGNTIHVYAQSDTTYGEAAGLFGINCKHYPTPFIPGVSLIRGEPQSPEENAKDYAESQEQRRLERNLRESKRDVLIAKAQGASKEEIDRLKEKARQDSAKIDEFCDKTGRVRYKAREGVYTQRSFPSKDKYDVAQFERTQKEQIEQFYKDGGAQKQYQAAVMNGGATQAQEESLDAKIQRLYDERSDFLRHNRLNMDEEESWAKYNKMTEDINALEEKKAAQEAAEKKAQEEKAAKIAQQKEQETRERVINEYKAKIEELERQRMKLIESGSDDYVTSDKLYSETERLTKKLETVQNGGYTIDFAEKTTGGEYVLHKGRKEEITLAGTETYTMPDGKRFIFKSNMDESHQTLTPEQLIDAYYTAPKELRDKTQNSIYVVDVYNPNDEYWQKKYKNFTHSYMTGGTEITIYRHDVEHDDIYLAFAMRHEMGHNIDLNNGEVQGTDYVWHSSKDEWKEAMRKDKERSGENSVSEYGENSNAEDFAESTAQYTKNKERFEQKYPNRAAILERLIYGGS